MHRAVDLDISDIVVQKFDLKNQKTMSIFNDIIYMGCGVANIKKKCAHFNLSTQEVSDPKMCFQGYSYRLAMHRMVDLDISDIVFQKFDLKNQKK